MQDEELWQAVLRRDEQYDGRFVYAVLTTGVYCRPTCPSRRPKRASVRFFAQPLLAEQAGFRACRRCRPDKAEPEEPHLGLVQQICRWLEGENEQMPTLEELARKFNLSPYYLQRTFKRITGVTPKQYASAHRLERFKNGLKNGQTVTQATYEAGYPSSSSVYEAAAGQLGMAPKNYQRGGIDMPITYTIVSSPLGLLLVAATPNGICSVKLGDREEELEEALKREFPAAAIQRTQAGLESWVSAILEYLRGAQPHLDLPLDIRATAFQQRVWKALQAIPYGSTRTYEAVAAEIGQPRAVRAVARACATNPTALVIPCHRVVRKNGELGGYRWGIERKQALLAQESGTDQAAGKVQG